jgi:DNA-binding CsgD family transcriptional regulator/tetratricopeptide (TPR) repeat protein
MPRADDIDDAGVAVPGSWVDDYRRLSSIDPAGLAAEELETLADAAWMVCRLEESTATRKQAYVRYLETRASRPAARVAWRLFWDHLYGGETVVAMGWLRRARRHLAAIPEEAEHGFVALADAELALNRGSLDEAEASASHAVEVGDRHGAQGIVGLALTLQGRILNAQGRHDEGCASLDEAMTLVLSGQLDDFFSGAVYCGLIAECREIADIRRGSEWTDAARAWCESLPATTPLHGICRVHRGEILCLRGAWEEAEAEIRTAGEELAAFKPPSAAEAFAALGELCRRRGDFAGAEDAFRRAHELGGDTQPGLALVRLAQGQSTAASMALRGALADTSRTPMERAQLLAAQVEAALSIDDVALAQDAVGELCSIAERLDRPVANARAKLGRGAVRLANRDLTGAMGDLRAACAIWSDLGLPYEEAQTRLLLGSAAKEFGDEEGAMLETEAACAGFERLGAGADLRRASAFLDRTPRPGGLTAREVDVLRLLAAGKTNRKVAAELVISEHTVGRHVQNIFMKLGVSSRAAATAFAVEHHLV